MCAFPFNHSINEWSETRYDSIQWSEALFVCCCCCCCYAISSMIQATIRILFLWSFISSIFNLSTLIGCNKGVAVTLIIKPIILFSFAMLTTISVLINIQRSRQTDAIGHFQEVNDNLILLLSLLDPFVPVVGCIYCICLHMINMFIKINERT